MKALSCHLSHASLGIVIINACLAYFGFQVGTILAGSIQAVIGGLDQAVRLLGLLLSIDGTLLCSRNLIRSQVIKTQYLVGELGADTSQLALQGRVVLDFLLVAAPVGPRRFGRYGQPEDPAT